MRKFCRVKKIFGGLIGGSMAVMVLTTSGTDKKDNKVKPVIIENKYWKIKVDPRWGGRISSMSSIGDNYDFVSWWDDVKQHRHGKSRAGGVARSMMSGSYVSSQPEEPFAVVKRTKTEAVLTYDNHYPMLNGLHEKKRISLDGESVVFSVKVTNKAKEPRVIYYRIQDWLGVGLGQGKDTVYIISKKSGSPFIFNSKPGKSINRHFLHPDENWYALADLVNNRGILVSLSKASAADIYFWGSGKTPKRRTAEIFFPQKKLLPGQSWEMEVKYTAFKPSDPNTGNERIDTELSLKHIEKTLADISDKQLRSTLPFNAELEMVSDTNKTLVITPLHPADKALGNTYAPGYGKTLKKIYLYGTPGEVVSFAFAVTAEKPVKQGTVSFSDLKNRNGNTIPGTSIDPKYVAGKSLILVNSWKLSQNIPMDTIGGINNNVVEAEHLTPFVLNKDQSAYVWSNLRIPENTPAGKYTGTCSIKTADTDAVTFKITLTVRPFKLIKAAHKGYGTFLDYHIKPLKGEVKGRNAPYMLTRDQYLDVLKVFADIGCTGFAIYVSKKDDLLWVLDKCAELGMKGPHVLIYPDYISPEDIKARNITAYAWVVDEPSRYQDIEHSVKKYKRILKKGWSPTFTPNLPLGLLLTDQMDKMVPIINCNGNAPYLIAATKRLKGEGRDVYWYECYGLGKQSVEQRALRGIYLWKEPVDGIYDWDNSSNRPKLNAHHLAGFAGTKVLRRLGLENTRQALTDLDYLYTLETLAKKTKNPKLRKEAEQLMDWIKNRFDSDYHNIMPYITAPEYLDDIRQRVAEMIEKLSKNQKSQLQ